MVFGSPTDIFKEQDTMFCDENTNNYKNNSPNNNIVFLDLTNKDSTLLCRNQPNINKNSLIIDDSNFLTANENTATEEVFESNLNFNEDKPNYIYQILNKTYEGRFQCACYNFESNEEQKKRLLETKKQTLFSKAKIAKIIVGHEFYRTNDFHVSSDRLVELANETAKLFPRYLAESFYTKANNNKSAGGLFQLHYAKQREKETAIGRLQKKATKRKLNDKENIASKDLETIQNSVSIIDEEYIELWASTAVEERKEIYLWKDIKQIFELFPNFSHPLGYKLIKEDFKNFCNKTVDLFSTNWNTVSKQIIAISKSKCSDKDIKAILKENNSIEEEHQTTLALILLPYLFKRTTKVPSRAKDRVPWTPTKIEVSKTFIFHIKAAILQQTAEYIYQLEQQKTQLLSQNLQLKRLVDQHEGGDVPTKKRKHESHGVVVSLPVHVSESGDEGLGSMSPEPLSVITVSADGHATVASNEIAELKRQLERERMSRSHLEKQISAMQSQIFPERFREEQLIAYQPHEVIEHTNNVLSQELEDGLPGLQVVSVVSVPTVGSTQTVETSNADSNTPPLSPQTSCEIIVPSSCGPAGVTSGGPEDATVVVPKDVTVGELLGESRPGSPKIVSFAGVPVFASSLDEQSNAAVAAAAAFAAGGGGVAYAASLPAAAVSGAATVVAAEFKASGGQFIGASPIRAFSPEQDGNQQQRLPSVLEAAIKAEPKVEVERLPSPSNSLDDGTPQARLYLANTSRQNLETIVEAIRHLEGDHLFSDEPAQDVPLALTNKVSTATGGSSPSAKQRLLHAEVNSFLQFHTTQQQQQQQQQPSTQQQQQQQQPNSSSTSAATQATTATVVAAATAVASQQQTQQRPGVIVVKHS